MLANGITLNNRFSNATAQFDADGNMTGFFNGFSWTYYSYDAESRNMGAVGGPAYAYDGDGNRVAKTGSDAVHQWMMVVILGTSSKKPAAGELLWSDASFLLSEAASGKGNFGLGSASAAEAEELGKAWVGSGARACDRHPPAICDRV